MKVWIQKREYHSWKKLEEYSIWRRRLGGTHGNQFKHVGGGSRSNWKYSEIILWRIVWYEQFKVTYHENILKKIEWTCETVLTDTIEKSSP